MNKERPFFQNNQKTSQVLRRALGKLPHRWKWPHKQSLSSPSSFLLPLLWGSLTWFPNVPSPRFIHFLHSINMYFFFFYCIPSTIQHATDTRIRHCFSPPGKPNLVGRQTRKEPIAIGNYSVVKAHTLKLPCH